MNSHDYPHLSRPPLREALIDIRLAERLSPDFLSHLKTDKFGEFSAVGTVKLGGFKFQPDRDKPALATVTSEEVLGTRFENADKSQVVGARLDGLSFSILRGYRNWEHISGLARGFWERFLDLSGPVQVGRLAVRYINVIEVPQGDDFDNYMTAAPRIPPGIPQLLSNFFERITVPFVGARAEAIITQALEGPTSVVVDIDVINQDKIDGNSPGLWDKLGELRIIKNQIFFSSVTTKTVELYR